MRRVAMIGPELTPIPPIRGGATENWIENVCRRMSRYHCAVYCPTDPELPRLETRNGVDYVRIAPGRLSRKLAEWLHRPDNGYAKRVLNRLEEMNPELVHVQNRPLIAAYLRQNLPSRVPIILQMHNLYNYLGKYERPEGDWSVPVDLFLAVSGFVLERERDRLGKDAKRLAVLHNGVDTDRYSPSGNEETIRELRRKHGLDGKRVVIYTGKLRENKGVSVLFRAMRTVFQHDACKDVMLLLVGGTHFGRNRADRKTDYYRRLMQMISNYEHRVAVTGFIRPHEMYPYYGLGNVYVCPSQLEEGFPSVLLEAMAARLPVVSTRKGGIPELVSHMETGILMENADDSEELAVRILELLAQRDECLRLGTNAREQVIRNFSWDVVAEKTESIYDELMENKKWDSGTKPF